MNPNEDFARPGASAEHPADLADRLQSLPASEGAALLRTLPSADAARALAEMDRASAAALAGELSPAEAASLLGAMPHDEAADVAALLDADRRSEVLGKLGAPAAARVADLMRYPPDSAGGIMQDRFIALPADATLADCQERLRQLTEEDMPSAAYLYVVDGDRRLLGVVAIRDLVFRKSDRLVRDVMNATVRFVSVDDDRETVARLFAQYHYLALPVMDRAGRLAGVVEARQVIGIVQDEATEDMQLMVGLSGEERTFTPWRTSLVPRLTWLLVNLATTFLAAAVVGMFEKTIEKWTVLAVFLPIVAGQGGNAGMQTLTVIIRGMALGELHGRAAWAALGKEATLGVLNGLAIGIVVGLAGWLWKGSLVLGVVVAVAMVLNMIAAAFSGVVIPAALRMAR
ncbi:MAG: magnesium transporter, partial [Verrucomicrobia bacterium A1]